MMGRRMTSYVWTPPLFTVLLASVSNFFLANYCIEIRTPTSPSPSPFHSRNIVIEATATTPEVTIVCFSVVLNYYAY